jgi:hypothetical protein
LTAFTGSFTIANKAVLEFGTADFGNVTFASGSTGTVKFDAPLTTPLTAFTGTISGLTPKVSIDLADLTYVAGKTTAGYSGGNEWKPAGFAPPFRQFHQCNVGAFKGCD